MPAKLGRMFLIFFLVIFFLPFVSPDDGGSRGTQAVQVEALDQLISMLEETLKSDPSRPEIWAQLGEALQSRDVNFHEGGTYQPRAMRAFDQALSFPLPDNFVSLLNCLFVCLFVLFVCSSVSLTACLTFCFPVCLFVCIRLTICQLVN